MKVADVLFSYLQKQGISQREFARTAKMRNPMPLTRLKQGALIDEINLRKAIKVLPPTLQKELRKAYEIDVQTKKGNWRKLGKNQSESFACHRVEKYFTSSIEFSGIAVRNAKRSPLSLRLKGDVIDEVNAQEKRYLRQRDEEEHNRSIEGLFAIIGKKEGEIFIGGECQVTLHPRKDSLLDLQWKFSSIDLSADMDAPDFLIQGNKREENHLAVSLRGTRIKHSDIYAFLLREMNREALKIAPWAISCAKEDQVGVNAHTLSQLLDRIQESIAIIEGKKTSIRKRRNLVLQVSSLKRSLQKSVYEYSAKLKLIQAASAYFSSRTQ